MKMINSLLKTVIIFLLNLSIISIQSTTLYAQDERVYVQVENNDVYLGEPFAFYIIVSSKSEPTPPPLEQIPGFSTQYLGASNSSTTNITVINGRTEKITDYRYSFNYLFTPEKAGVLQIPALNINVAGKTYQTEPIEINVSKPKNDPSFRLKQTLSKKEVYVGEPITLTVTWYLASNASDFNFTFPLLSDSLFEHKQISPSSTNPNNIIRFDLNGEEILAQKGVFQEGNQIFTTVSFKQILIPQKSGEFKLPEIIVSGKKIVDYKRSQRRSGFSSFFDNDPFFDSFVNEREPIYQRFAVPSNQPTLIVKDVPTKNKPYDYTGLVGDYSIITNATPTDVSVGDPITLTIEVAGPDYMQNIHLYPLNKQEDLTRDFKVPQEMSKPEIKTGLAVFTQTIRPLRADITEIPSLRLSYFDSSKGEYVTAKSDPIPLTVSSAKVITAADAVGLEPVKAINDSLETTNSGISYNYTDPKQLLITQETPSSIINDLFWITLAIAPICIFLFLLLLRTIKEHKKNSVDTRTNQNIKELNKLCKNGASPKDFSEAFRRYISKKFAKSIGSTFFQDIYPELEKNNLSKEQMDQIESLYKDLDAACYAGIKDDELSSKLQQAINIIEKNVK